MSPIFDSQSADGKLLKPSAYLFDSLKAPRREPLTVKNALWEGAEGPLAL